MGVDPDSGEDVVADRPTSESADDLPENDPHLLLYNLLFDEIKTRISHHYQSLLTGLSVIGLVMAYALLTGELVFLAVIPVIIGVLFVQSIRHLNSILWSAQHLNEIEDRFSDEYPLFVWESDYGMTGSKRAIVRGGINWSRLPAGIMYVFGALGYFGFAYVGYVVWPPDGIDIIAVGLTRSGLLVVYGVLTSLIGLVGYSHYVHIVELTRETEP